MRNIRNDDFDVSDETVNVLNVILNISDENQNIKNFIRDIPIRICNLQNLKGRKLRQPVMVRLQMPMIGSVLPAFA
jgi:hypothetical protein